MCYLFREGLESGDVLRIGQETISVEYQGDGPKWRILSDGKYDPVYPYFALRQISELTNDDIERIGEQVKVHLKARRTLMQRKNNELIAKHTLSVEQGELSHPECWTPECAKLEDMCDFNPERMAECSKREK